MTDESDKGILERREGILDKLEQQTEEGESKRPMRDALENATERVPAGPLGKAGEGNVAGVAGYFAISTGQTAVLPIPGVRQPGYKAISHGVEDRGNFERHTIRINAASKHIAEVAVEYEYAAASNVDYLTSELEIHEVNKITERSTFTTWEVVVDVADRGQKES